MGNFEFSLGQIISIDCSGEQGEVIGRSEYLEQSNQYLVRYKCADGRAVEAWWAEMALVAEEA